MNRTGLNRNFTLTLLDTLIKGIPYMFGRIQYGYADGFSCLNSVLFFWYNVEHHFDGQAGCRDFSLFLRNKYDWNVPEGIPKGQIIETDSESRLIYLDFDLNRITLIPASDLIKVFECLCSLPVTDPYPDDWYKTKNKKAFNGFNLFWVPVPPRPEEQCSHVLESNRERSQDYEGMPWDTGKMSIVQEQYIKDLRVALGLDEEEYQYHFPNQYAIEEMSKYRELELKAARELENTLENGVKTEDTPGSQNPENLKKSIIIRLRDSGLITVSPYYKDNDTKSRYYYVTDLFTPENIKKCLSTDRIKWQTIAEFEAIIPEPYKKETNYTPVPMDSTTLQRTAFNKARYRK